MIQTQTNAQATEVADQTEDMPIPQRHAGDGVRESWRISLDTLNRNIAHCRPEVRQTLRECFIWSTRHAIDFHDFCAQANVNQNTLYKLLFHKYFHPQTGVPLDMSQKMLQSLQKWLRDTRAHASKRESFVLTPTAQKVLRACAFARESQTPVFLFGPSHIGKTWALEHESETNNHGQTPYFRIRAAGGIMGLLKLIATGVGVSPNSNREQLKERLFNALDRDMVLIFDEVHELLHTYQHSSFMACVEFLRELHDVVGCGMLLSMTNFGRDQFANKRQAALEQIMRRGVHRFQLPDQPLKKDLELILAANGLDMPKKSMKVEVQGIGEKPYELLRQLGKQSGLKAITERIRYAKKLAERDKRELPTWEDFVRAHYTVEANSNAENDWN